jgi:hypothetical protein
VIEVMETDKLLASHASIELIPANANVQIQLNSSEAPLLATVR